MKFEFLVASRYLFNSKLQTSLLVSGVTLGVIIFVFITSIINGLAAFLIGQVIGNCPHITIEPRDKEAKLFIKNIDEYKKYIFHEVKIKNNLSKNQIRNWQIIDKIINNHRSVLASSPQVVGNGFIIRNQNIRHITLIGILPEKLSAISNIESRIIMGEDNLNIEGLILGETLAKDLGLKVGQPVLIKSDTDNSKKLTLQGIFNTGMEFLDKRVAYIDLRVARNLFNLIDSVSRIEIKLHNLWETERVSAEISQQTQLKATFWQQQETDLYNALVGQARTGQIIKLFSLVMIIIGIASTLLINTYRRRTEIGIMRSFGMTKGFIARVFIFQSTLIGGIGVITGCILGYIICFALFSIKFSNGQPILPLIPEDGGYSSVILATLIGSIIAGILPARVASNIDPVQVINQ